MARVVLLCPDLLFGSKVEGALAAAGHDVERLDAEDTLSTALEGAGVLIVDLTADAYDGAAVVEGLRGVEDASSVPVLGFYSHVDVETRRRAEAAGFDLVVPRSRMARETAMLVDRLVAA